jgi:type II secretory pathway pseudopilin PulG
MRRKSNNVGLAGLVNLLNSSNSTNSSNLPIQQKSEAFTLLELLVTSAIVSGSFAIILGAFSLSLRTSGITANNLNANTFLENKIAEVEFSPQKKAWTRARAKWNFQKISEVF